MYNAFNQHQYGVRPGLPTTSPYSYSAQEERREKKVGLYEGGSMSTDVFTERLIDMFLLNAGGGGGKKAGGGGGSPTHL